MSHTPLLVLCGYLERLSPGTHIEEVADKKVIKVPCVYTHTIQDIFKVNEFVLV